VTTASIVLGILVGLSAGVLSGMFGVGGGVVTTPAIQVLLGAPPYVAVGTPLPVIFPTALVGAYTYARAGEISMRAAAWAAGPGMIGAASGAALTSLINPHWLLLATAALIAWQAVRVGRGGEHETRPRGTTPSWQYAVLGLATGVVSGLLGIGGGVLFVPIVTTILGMPLKRALGSSLLVIAAVAIPGTIVHALLGHIDWAIFLVLVAGVVPGARIGAKIALGTAERTLRILVGAFLGAVGLAYATHEIAALAGSRG